MPIKLAETVITSLWFRALWPNRLICFGRSKKSVYEWKYR